MTGMDFRDIVVDFATAGDAQVLSTMSRDWVEAGLDWSYRADRIARLIASPNHTAVLARDGSRIVGFAIMEFGDERAHLVLLAVRPSHRRRGIARRLANWLIDSAITAGASSVHVEVRESNPPAHALYLALGFEESLRIEGYYQGRETAVRMIRMLRAPAPPLPAWTPPPRLRH
jgi:ribosomal protein S18 acetylase RimI-like enzyme